MIDFTNCTEKINKFRGSEKKKTIEYNGKTYLLKFPNPTREKGKVISYINNTVCCWHIHWKQRQIFGELGVFRK